MKRGDAGVRPAMGNWIVRGGLAACVAIGSLGAAAQKPPALQDFAWRGSLVLPQAGTPLQGQAAGAVRLELPGAALVQLQGRNAEDVRVFNLAGDAVPMVRLGAPPAEPVAPLRTAPYRAYPLFAAEGKAPARSAVEVQLEEGAGATRAWVRWEATPAAQTSATTSALPTVLVDMRTEKQAVQALDLDLQLPANTLVAFNVAISADLKTWFSVDTTGPLYRFDGADAPTNTTLGLRGQVPVQGRYLRLGWTTQGVEVRSVQGVVAQAQQVAMRVHHALPTGQLQERESQTWNLPFATPIQSLSLSALEDATLLPVRIQGRNDAAEPWRNLGGGVVYRVAQGGAIRSNAPFVLNGASVRQLRVQSLPGQPLPAGGLQAALEFDPVRLVFLTQGQGPYTLAVGRPATPPAWGDAAVLAGAVGGKLEDLPAASVASAVVAPQALDAPVAGVAARWLPEGVTVRTALLWVVLGFGVLILGAVALALFRQLGRKDA